MLQNQQLLRHFSKLRSFYIAIRQPYSHLGGYAAVVIHGADIDGEKFAAK